MASYPRVKLLGQVLQSDPMPRQSQHQLLQLGLGLPRLGLLLLQVLERVENEMHCNSGFFSWQRLTID